MCLNPGMNADRQNDWYVEFLWIAAGAAGGTQELARRLGVDATQLASWLFRQAAPPVEAVMDALDLIGHLPCNTRPGDELAPDRWRSVDRGPRTTTSDARR